MSYDTITNLSIMNTNILLHQHLVRSNEEYESVTDTDSIQGTDVLIVFVSVCVIALLLVFRIKRVVEKGV